MFELLLLIDLTFFDFSSSATATRSCHGIVQRCPVHHRQKFDLIVSDLNVHSHDMMLKSTTTHSIAIKITIIFIFICIIFGDASAWISFFLSLFLDFDYSSSMKTSSLSSHQLCNAFSMSSCRFVCICVDTGQGEGRCLRLLAEDSAEGVPLELSLSV